MLASSKLYGNMLGRTENAWVASWVGAEDCLGNLLLLGTQIKIISPAESESVNARFYRFRKRSIVYSTLNSNIRRHHERRRSLHYATQSERGRW